MDLLLDLNYIGLAALFFGISWALVELCGRV